MTSAKLTSSHEYVTNRYMPYFLPSDRSRSFLLWCEPHRGRDRLPLLRVAPIRPGYLTDGANTVEELAAQLDLLIAELESFKEEAKRRIVEAEEIAARKQRSLF